MSREIIENRLRFYHMLEEGNEEVSESMNTIAVVGLQWGDEGKGRVVDLLSQEMDGMIRAQGGHNAGHTIVTGGKEYYFHLIPSAILHRHVRCYS